MTFILSGFDARAAGTGPGSQRCGGFIPIEGASITEVRAAKAMADLTRKPVAGPVLILPFDFRSGLQSTHPA